MGNNLFLDVSDFRYSNSLKLGGTTLTYGATVNNSPSSQDMWNTTPVCGSPQAESGVALTPTAKALIDGPLFQKVGGIGAYGYWNNLIYGEVSVYRTGNKGTARPLTAGTTIDIVTEGAVPYWRLALDKVWGAHSVELGTFGLVADVFPPGLTSGPTDRFTDTGLDGQYQYIGKKHIFTFHTIFIHEKQIWDASFPPGLTANRSDSLNTFRVNGNYYYRSRIGTIGGSVGFFQTTGSKGTGLYAPAPLTGSITGRPDSRGYVLELDYLPWEKLKLTLQYTIFNRFNGSTSNYDGFGRSASDNNILYFVANVEF